MPYLLCNGYEKDSRTGMKRKLPLVAFLLFFHFITFSQPYVDIVSVQGFISGANHILSDKTQNPEINWWSAQLTIPHLFKKDSSLLIFSPGYDHWNIDEGNLDLRLQTFYLPVTYLMRLSPHSRLSFTAIPRINYSDEVASNTYQYGGALVYTWRKNKDFALKGGIYYNREFFGNNFLPLAGIDWKANNRLYIFGLLPNNFFIDYKFHEKLHGGFAYKGITSSFRPENATSTEWFSLEEGELKLFIDFYLTKKLVFNIEAGQTAARNYRTGIDSEYSKFDFNEGYLFKAGICYRMWLN